MPPPDPAASLPLDRIEPHLREAARILTELAAEIEALGARLCTDPAVIARHLTELQAIDQIAQKQQQLAALLLADCPHAAVDAMGMDAVRQRIGQTLGPRRV
ncbi:hypothetical protein H7F51_08700 [Novosphingobium flavum]|uniref:Uncharacterized protein n=2 Tax=Novosphingobium flavum TaxID=1778672 RepID=A0A7X1FRG2_9SPHN|nr:hypothetical protein [Novosphingobium flavum]